MAKQQKFDDQGMNMNQIELFQRKKASNPWIITGVVGPSVPIFVAGPNAGSGFDACTCDGGEALRRLSRPSQWRVPC